MHILDLPVELLEVIIKLGYRKRITLLRTVCKRFDEICRRLIKLRLCVCDLRYFATRRIASGTTIICNMEKIGTRLRNLAKIKDLAMRYQGSFLDIMLVFQGEYHYTYKRPRFDTTTANILVHEIVPYDPGFLFAGEFITDYYGEAIRTTCEVVNGDFIFYIDFDPRFLIRVRVAKKIRNVIL